MHPRNPAPDGTRRRALSFPTGAAMARQVDARMTPRQRRFVAEYLVDCNGKQAAIRAGYGPKTAAHEAWKLLNRRPNVARAVEDGMRAQEARTHISADKALQEIARIAFSDVGRLFETKDGEVKVKDLASLSEADRAAIARIVVTKDRIDIRLHDKRAALLDLARHLGVIGKRTDSQPALRAKDELPAREILRRKLAQMAGEKERGK
jgi:phage terminase small subunit